MNSIGQIRKLESDEDIVRAELLRLEAYNLSIENFDIMNSYYFMAIRNNLIIPFGFFINDRLVAACYVSNTFNSLYIDQLFVRPIFQNTGLHFGRSLLRYILVNKKMLEELFGQELHTSILEPIDNKCVGIYEKEGYVKQPDESMVKKI